MSEIDQQVPSKKASASSEQWRRHGYLDARWEYLDDTGPMTLVSQWERRWVEDLTAVVMRDVGTGRTISAGHMEEETARRARALRGLGVQRSSRVALSILDPVEFVLCYAAVLRSGAIAVPLNPHYRPREALSIFEDALPSVLIADRTEAQSELNELLQVPHITPTFDSLHQLSFAEELVQPAPEDGALMLYTSGTTGRPKGVVHTHSALAGSTNSLGIAWRWSSEDCLTLSLPLFHMHGLGVGVHGALSRGSMLQVSSGFDTSSLLAEIGRGATSLFFGVPTLYGSLMNHANRGALAKVRLAVSGSAPLPETLFHSISAATGQKVLERYGMTETVMILSNPYEGERRPGTVGFELPGVEVKLTQGDSGEILVRGSSTFHGYWRRQSANVDAFDSEGWFRTGDIGQRDREGYVSIVGRSKELIISGGYNVYPREIENVLEGLPGVAECAVVGRPSERWGEEVVAVIVATAAGSPTVAQLNSWCRDHLVNYKVPKEYIFVESLPRNHMGKVVRSELEARVRS